LDPPGEEPERGAAADEFSRPVNDLARNLVSAELALQPNGLVPASPEVFVSLSHETDSHIVDAAFQWWRGRYNCHRRGQ
jgi:hypothetical protein